jgi:Ca2+:H+ antiporter
MLNKFFLSLLVFVPVTCIGEWLHISPTLLFVFSALAIIPLAKYIGEATEELTIYTGPALGGLLNATFGNATELIISIFAIKAGLFEVVKASLTGSIIGNLLLVLGLAMFVGGYKREYQSFNTVGAKSAASSLLLAVVALVVPAIFVMTSPTSSGDTVETLSILVSCCMIVAYIGGLFFSLHTHKHLYTAEIAELEHGTWSKKKSITVLILTTIGVAFMSETLVASIEPLIATFGWTELFVGVIFVAIIGNAAEHASAITVAIKDKMDLSLQVAVGSSTQIAMFVAPALVLISMLFGQPMTLVFQLFELVTIVFSVLIVNSIIEDGKSHWYEGMQLLITYLILALAFYFHP